MGVAQAVANAETGKVLVVVRMAFEARKMVTGRPARRLPDIGYQRV